jgi:predicted ATPase
VWPWLRDHGRTNPWELTVDEQLLLQRHAIIHKIENERGKADFVSDRTTVDAACLLMLRMQLLAHPIPYDLIHEALAHARATYDVAILMGPWRLSPPEAESVDPALRERENALTSRLYQSLGTRIIEVPQMAAADIAPFILGALRAEGAE